MGARGPQPTPTKLKLLRGETRPSRLNRQEPQPRSGYPRLPADLGAATRRIWAQIKADMAATGVITGADAIVLRLLCEAVARYHHAAGLLEQTGPIIAASGTGARRGELVKNPLVQIVRDEAVLIRSLARELGLTPSARAGLRSSGETERDPFADFLDGATG